MNRADEIGKAYDSEFNLRNGDRVVDGDDNIGRIIRLYTKGNQEMATVEYETPVFTGEHELDWEINDLTRVSF